MKREKNRDIAEVYEERFHGDWEDLDVGEFDACRMYLDRYLLQKGMKVLDVGCGTGRYSNYLLSEGFQSVYAVDLFQKAPFEKRGFCYKQASMEKLPFEDAFFDFILAQSVLHYAEDLDKVILELKRVLKSGGMIFLSCHTKHSIFTLVRRLKRAFGCKSAEHLKGIRFKSVTEYERLLREHAFDIITVDGWGMCLFDSIFRGISFLSCFVKIKFSDPRKRICKNESWRRLKSKVGYHFVILARRMGEVDE